MCMRPFHWYGPHRPYKDVVCACTLAYVTYDTVEAIQFQYSKQNTSDNQKGCLNTKPFTYDIIVNCTNYLQIKIWSIAKKMSSFTLVVLLILNQHCY